MQISTTRHSSRVSTRGDTGCGYSVAGSDLNRETSRTGVTGADGRDSGKGASTTEAWAAGTRTKAVSGRAGSMASLDDTGSPAAPSGTEATACTTAGSGGFRLDEVIGSNEALASA